MQNITVQLFQSQCFQLHVTMFHCSTMQGKTLRIWIVKRRKSRSCLKIIRCACNIDRVMWILSCLCFEKQIDRGISVLSSDGYFQLVGHLGWQQSGLSQKIWPYQIWLLIVLDEAIFCALLHRSFNTNTNVITVHVCKCWRW